MRQWWLICVVALSVFAAACGGDSDDDGADTTDEPEASEPDDGTDDESAAGEDVAATDGSDGLATTEPVELTASYRGVTEETIKIGLTSIDAEALLDFSVEFAAIDAAIFGPAWAAPFNAAGGAHGRMIETVSAKFLPVGTQTTDELCVQLTEDERVFMVVGNLLGDGPLCFTELNDTPYLGYFGLTDERERRSSVPFIAVEMAADDQRRNSVQVLLDEGLLDDVKLAVWWGVAGTDLANETVLPMLEAAGVDVVATGEIPDFGSDTVAGEDFADTVFARFAASDADTYLNLSGIVPFNRTIERNSPNVQVIHTNGQVSNAALNQSSGYDPDIMDGAIAVAPSKRTLDEWLEDPGFLECIDELNASGLIEIDLATLDAALAGSIGQACQGWELLEQVLVAAGPDLTPDTLRSAVEGLGDVELPGMEGASFGPDRFAGGNAMRFYEYDPDMQAMVPVGEPLVVG